MDWKEQLFKLFMDKPFSSHKPVELEMFISTEIIEKLIEDRPSEPEHWDNWSIERQLGYKFALEDSEKQLRAKWL